MAAKALHIYQQPGSSSNNPNQRIHGIGQLYSNAQSDSTVLVKQTGTLSYVLP